MITSIVRSLLITLFASVGITLVFYLFGGFNPVKTFIIIITSLFVVGFLLGQISDTLASVNNKKLENDRIKEFSKQGVSIDCAYCGEQNFIPIRFDIKNEFDCNNCNKKNSIYIDIITTQITSPLQAPQMQIQTINPDQQEAIDKIQNG